MDSQTELVFYGAVFLATLLLVQGLYWFYVDRRASRSLLERRLGNLSPSDARAEAARTLRRGPADGIGVAALLGDLPGRFEQVARQAGSTVSLRRTLVIMALLFLAAFAGALLLTLGARPAGIGAPGAIGISLGAGAVLGVGVPLAYLRRLRAQRQRRFAVQLPDALDVMARSLQAGHPVPAAMAAVNRELPDPIGAEFGVLVDELTYGMDLRDALAHLSQRAAVEDLRYVVVAINIQHETGGNLAELLHRLAKVIRARFRMESRVRALSAEARLSAKILGAMPLVFAGLVLAANPGFYLEVADDPLFLPVLGGALCLEGFGAWIMFRLVRFRI